MLICGYAYTSHSAEVSRGLVRTSHAVESEFGPVDAGQAPQVIPSALYVTEEHGMQLIL